MGIKLITNKATLGRIIADRIVEQPIDTDFVLPDYCPDISRMLKCRTTAKIVSKSVNKNILTLGGNVCVGILYLDNDSKEIRSYTSTVSFTKECELDEDAENCEIVARAGVDYLNCRAVTSRKLDLHGAVSIHFTVKSKEKSELLCSAEGSGVQVRCKNCDNTAKISIGEKNIVVSEDIEIPQSNGNIRCIIRGEAKAIASECKAVGDKAIIKGELGVYILYTSGTSGDICRLETQIPFSQIIDVLNIECENSCKAITEVSSLELRPKVGLDGESKVITVSAVVSASVMCSFNESVGIVTDSYSTDYNVEVKRKNITLKKEIDRLTEKFTVKKTVELTENIISVADLWCEVKNETVKTAEDGIVITGTVAAQLIAITSSQTPLYIEKPFEYSYKLRSHSLKEDCRADPSVNVVSASYTITSASTVEIRCEISAEADVFQITEAEVITDVLLAENAQKKEKGDSSLIIYYAKSGEIIWDIARNYNTSVRQIMSANSITEDCVPADMPLLVPII